MANDTTNAASAQAATESIFITIQECADMLGCSYSSAQKLVAQANKRCKELNLFVLTGRANRRAVMELLGCNRESFFDAPKGAR